MFETQPPQHAFHPPPTHLHTSDITALVLVWSFHEPVRIGQLIPVPNDGLPRLVVRGPVQAGGALEALPVIRQRPGLNESTGPLLAPTLSREQLRVTALPSGELEVENLGRCPLLINDSPVQRAVVRPGDVLELSEQLVLFCVRRPQLMPPMSGMPMVDFGGADTHGLVGESPACWELRRQIHFVAGRNAHVLIQGESGTGKELVACAIHALSARGRKRMISRNAATFPETLIDAELFGNAKNYPNPGMADRPGLVGEADGSTLFLDEFGELSSGLQSHLLRLLDDGEYQRLGESTPRRVDLRLITATNRPESYLKHDILARLKLRVQVPDLNVRREDIPLLTRHLLHHIATRDSLIANRFFDEPGRPARPRISPRLISALLRHHYTTHVRELEALLWRALAASREDYIDLPDGLMMNAQTAASREPFPPLPLSALVTVGPVAASASTPPATTSIAAAWEASLDRPSAVLLELFRRHSFNVSNCSRDPACPVERATADLNLRVLMLRALQFSGWDLPEAAALMTGGDAQWLQPKVLERMNTLLANFRERLETEAEGPLREKLARYYRGNFRWVEATLDALKTGQLLP